MRSFLRERELNFQVITASMPVRWIIEIRSVKIGNFFFIEK